MAAASAPPSATPASSGRSGSSGYSADGSVVTVNAASPQVMLSPSGSSAMSTGSPGRLRVISAKSLPGTKATPGSETSARTRIRAETS